MICFQKNENISFSAKTKTDRFQAKEENQKILFSGKTKIFLFRPGGKKQNDLFSAPGLKCNP